MKNSFSFHQDDVFGDFFKGVVVADDEELAKGFDVSDRFGELISAHSIHNSSFTETIIMFWSRIGEYSVFCYLVKN